MAVLNVCLLHRISQDLTEKQVKSFIRMARIAYGVMVCGVTMTVDADGNRKDFPRITMNNSKYSSNVVKEFEEFCLEHDIDFSLDDLYTDE